MAGHRRRCSYLRGFLSIRRAVGRHRRILEEDPDFADARAVPGGLRVRSGDPAARPPRDRAAVRRARGQDAGDRRGGADRPRGDSGALGRPLDPGGPAAAGGASRRGARRRSAAQAGVPEEPRLRARRSGDPHRPPRLPRSEGRSPGLPRPPRLRLRQLPPGGGRPRRVAARGVLPLREGMGVRRDGIRARALGVPGVRNRGAAAFPPRQRPRRDGKALRRAPRPTCGCARSARTRFWASGPANSSEPPGPRAPPRGPRRNDPGRRAPDRVSPVGAPPVGVSPGQVSSGGRRPPPRAGAGRAIRRR